MSYVFGGKVITEDRYYNAVSEDEARAKFAYFREAESKINGGPAPIQGPRYGASKCGTNGGYMRHFRLKEKRCDSCKAAHVRAEMVRYWKVRGGRLSSPIGPKGRARTTPEISPKASKIGSDNPRKEGVRNG